MDLMQTHCAGSAAYNLLMITSVCILAVPEGQSKTITMFGVFIWTAFMSLFAYLWLLIVYQFWTPDEVTIAEAVITFLLTFVLVGVAYLLDSKPWKSRLDGVVVDDAKPHLYQVR
jgi:solute carrier family 8 (sodium/calcium exchanger)